MTSPERSHPNLPWLTSADGYIAAKHSHDLEAEAGLKQGEAAFAFIASCCDGFACFWCERHGLVWCSYCVWGVIILRPMHGVMHVANEVEKWG